MEQWRRDKPANLLCCDTYSVVTCALSRTTISFLRTRPVKYSETNIARYMYETYATTNLRTSSASRHRFPKRRADFPRLPLMTVRRLESRLHVVASSHHFVLGWALGRDTGRDRLRSSGYQKWGISGGGIPAHLELDVIVRPKEQRDRVAADAAPVYRAVHSGLEDIVCVQEYESGGTDAA